MPTHIALTIAPLHKEHKGQFTPSTRVVQDGHSPPHCVVVLRPDEVEHKGKILRGHRLGFIARPRDAPPDRLFIILVIVIERRLMHLFLLRFRIWRLEKEDGPVFVPSVRPVWQHQFRQHAECKKSAKASEPGTLSGKHGVHSLSVMPCRFRILVGERGAFVNVKFGKQAE